jgi:hypothetical protein
MMMLRLSTWLWLAVVGAVGYGMFQVKYEVMLLEDELGRVNRGIDADRDQLRVLNAEWSFLNQPARLDQLRQRFLALKPITRTELGSLDQVPFRAATDQGAPAPGAPTAPAGAAPPNALAPRPTPPTHGAQLVSVKPGVN